MTIRLKVFISSGLSLALIAVLLVSLLYSHLQVRVETERDKISETLVRHSSEFLILIDEFMVTRSVRVEEQWRIKYQQIVNYLDESSASIETGSLAMEYEILYQNLTQLTNSIQMNPDMMIRDNPRTLLLSQQIMLTSQSIWLKVFAISEKANKRIREINDRVLMSIILFSVLISFLIVLTMIFTVARVSNPLTALVAAVRELGSSDFGTRPEAIQESKRKDEVDELSRGFNRMTVRLFESFNKLSRELKERRRAEERIVQIRNFLRSILNSMPFSIISLDANGRVTEWNHNARIKTGIPNDRALQQSIEVLLPDLAADLKKREIGYQLSDVRQFLRREIDDRHTETYEEVIVFPFSESGQDGIVLRIEDVTERKRMEEVMVQNEKIMSLGGMAAGMAHEINNPLAGMIHSIQNIQNRISNPELKANILAAERADVSLEAVFEYLNDRGIDRMLDSVLESGGRINQIIRNMLNFARKGEGSFEQISIDHLIRNTLQLASADYDVQKQYRFNQVEVLQHHENPRLILECEVSKIQQVMLNLIRNGVQAMLDGGITDPSITIRSSQSFNESGRSYVHIEFEDNGPGISTENLKRIFQPFFTTKHNTGGTGLGLSISKYIIAEIHQGDLTVCNGQSGGTVFSIDIPQQHSS